MAGPRVFSIPPGAPFLATFTKALTGGALLGGAAAPFDLGRAKIYVPTRRAARALRQHIADHFAPRGALLPAIVPLGAIDGDADAALFGEAEGGSDFDEELAPAIGETERRLILMRLILGWARRLRHAIISVDAQGNHEFDETEQLLVAATPADAWRLSGDLAGLIDELAIEGVEWRQLEPFGIGTFDKYWRITLDFLNIAVRQWPEILASRNLIDGAARRALLIEREITALKSGAASGPVIAAGSTGTNKATADLLAAIARSAQGAIVLPGLDVKLDDASWRAIGGDAALKLEPSPGHPQAALARLLGVLGIARGDVRELGVVPAVRALRGRFVSEAMRPAATTDLWRGGGGKKPGPSDIRDALAALTLITAPDERTEALALAIAMREVLQTRMQTAALITPDRGLAQRVAAELRRWSVEVEDSAGAPLRQTPVGALAGHILACCASASGAAQTLTLLAHNACHLGFSRAEIEAVLPMLEIGVLRSPAAAAGLADSAAVIAKARAAAQEKYAHPALARIGAEGWDAIGTVLTRLHEALAPLTDMPDEAPLPQWAQAHFSALAALARDETGEPALEGADAAALAAVFEDFTAGADTGLAFSLADYAAFFDRVSAEAVVREPLRRHPRLAILGLLEARLVDADVVLLGGLDETVWPPQARGDAFLNRPLRAELGLSAPERRIGQTAHDFVQALGHERVILSRALKRGRAPTVASRFLQRMGALAGDEWHAVAARGARLLALAREIDRPDREGVAVTRPKPCPPLALRPRGLSVTRIETLRRDPYSIYARHILRLLPLEPLGAGVSARDYGNWLHEALAQFGRAFPKGPLPVNAEEKLFALAQASFAPIAGDPEFVTFKWPQIRAGLMKYLGWERGRRPGLARLAVETRGEISISLADGSLFKLSANADRIELGAAGEAHIFDYKTGALPSAREISAGFSPQLSLEGAILLQQGFSELPHVEPLGEIAFVKFGGGDIFTTRSVAGKNIVLGDLVAGQFAELIDLLNQFREPETVYASRPFPQFLARYSDYDHLARVLEWSVGAEEEAS